jgi:two-component system, chemotaxis family, chemotaxis protein CheY
MANILVVEDEPVCRSVLSDSLEDFGYSVTAAADGNEALERLRTQPWDAVVLDLLMPVVDGFTFLEQRISDPELLRVPVIVLSASGRRGLRAASQMYATAVLAKPFDLDVLLGVVRRVLGHPSGAPRIRERTNRPIGTCPVCGVPQLAEMDQTQFSINPRGAIDTARVKHVLSHTPEALANLPIRVRLLKLPSERRRILARWLYDDLRHNWGDQDRSAVHGVHEVLGSVAMHRMWQAVEACAQPGCRHHA